jgi:hypothetical protein
MPTVGVWWGLSRRGYREAGPSLSEISKRAEKQSVIAFLPARMLLFVSSVKLVAEIAVMALIGQFILGLLAGPRRETNFFYKLLQLLTDPFVKFTRIITPRIVIDRHVPLATLCLLVGVWLFATIAKVNLCLQIGVQQCH